MRDHWWTACKSWFELVNRPDPYPLTVTLDAFRFLQLCGPFESITKPCAIAALRQLSQDCGVRATIRSDVGRPVSR